MSAAQGTARHTVRVLRTEEPTADRRFRAWGDLVVTACGPRHIHRAAEGSFDGAMVTGRFGSVQLTTVRAEAHTVELTEVLASRPGTPALYLTCVLDGEVRVSQGDQTAVATAGTLFSYDTARPFTLRMQRAIHMVTVRFDHRLVDLKVGFEHPLRGATWSGREGVSVVLVNLLQTVASHMTELDPWAAECLGNSVASLVSAVCAEKLDADGGPAAARRARLQRIKAYARAHLGNPELTPGRLASIHNVSLRYLQLLFQDEDTSPALWIRNERLERCRDDLCNPRTAHLTVANVAERWGLHGASHFSRLFRERYGMTPREWRKQALELTS